MAKFTLLHVDAISMEMLQDEQAELAKIDAEIVLFKGAGEDDLIEAAKHVDGILDSYTKLSRRLMESLDNCKVIVRYGVGVDTIDLDAATDCGIAVAHLPDYCIDEVSDHAMMLILACNRKLCRMNSIVKSGRWVRQSLAPIGRTRGQTLGLVAFGRIAKAVSIKAKAFGMRVLAYDPYIPREVFDQYGVEFAPLDRLLAESDYVSVHTPLTAETRHMIGADCLRRMKPGAYLINTSRGPVVDTSALAQALHEGWIAGAGLDVVEGEPIAPDNPMIGFDNVILTPHMAFYSDASAADQRLRVAQEAARVLTGHWPRNLANPALREKLTLAD